MDSDSIPWLTKAYLHALLPYNSAFQSELITTCNNVLKETCPLLVSGVRGQQHSSCSNPSSWVAAPATAGKDRSVLRAGSQQGPRTQQEADVHLDVCELLRYLGTPPTLRTWRVLGGEFPEVHPSLTQLY